MCVCCCGCFAGVVGGVVLVAICWFAFVLFVCMCVVVCVGVDVLELGVWPLLVFGCMLLAFWLLLCVMLCTPPVAGQ